MKWIMRHSCRVRSTAMQTFRDGGQGHTWPSLRRFSKRRRWRPILKGCQHARKWKIRIIPHSNRRWKAAAHGPYHFGWFRFHHGNPMTNKLVVVDNLTYRRASTCVGSNIGGRWEHGGRLARGASFPKSFATVESFAPAPVRALIARPPSLWHHCCRPPFSR
jgi:hypothetical protein